MRKFDLCKRLIAMVLACFITLSVFSCITFAQTTDGVVVETVDDTTGGDDWGDTVPDEGGGGDNIPDEDLGEIPDEDGNEGIGGEGDGDLEDGTGGSDDQDKIDYTTAVSVSTAEELEQALANKETLIRIDANFNLDRTFYITSDVIIFSEEAHTLLRSVNFGADIFVVGENPDGTATEKAVTLTLGKPDSSDEELLIIDGNKDNMTVDVVGSAIFVVKNSTADLYKNVTIKNCKKVGNERTLLGTYGVSYPPRVGGAVAIVTDKAKMNIYGGYYVNNGVNEVADDNNTCIQGGAIYNFGTTSIYGGTFSGNRSTHGGAFFNYRKMYIYNATISENSATSLGGAIYVPNSTGAFLYIGQENDVVESDVTFSDNTADDDGGAIYARNVLTIENTTFGNNTASGYGGAIVAYTPKITVDNSVFYNNKSASYGGAIYVSGNNNAYDEVELNITDTIFESNTATSYGGALAVVSEARLYATKVDFIGNSSKYAGAVYTSNGSVEIDEATFTDNSTTSHGACMGSYEGAKALLNNITAYGNTAGGSGGFAVNTGADLTIYNSSIFDNSSKNIGGAIYYTTDASGAIYATSFKNNTAKGNAGAVGVYTGGTKVLMHSCTFENNVSSAFGGAIFVSGKSILDLYNITAVANTGSHGGFMYETAASTVVTAIGITVSENTATTGGNTIWGNTNNAKLYIDISKYVDLSYDGDWDEDYWASAVANLLKVYEISEDLPSYIDYKTGEEISPPAPSVTANISSASQLERALKAKLGKINITADITVDRTFYVTGSVTIFSKEAHTLKRATDFGGDIFVVGESADGKVVSGGATLKLGDPDSTDEGLLTIDGNKDNMTVDVVGSAIFVVKNSTANLYKNVTIKNCKKVGNERTLLGTYGVSYPVRVGGSVAIVSEKANMNIYGGTYTDNGVNEVADANDTCIQGGAIYNFGTFKIYGGTFKANRSLHGGALFNYRKTYIYNATFSNNHSENLGGAIYLPNSTGAFLYIGDENEIVESAITFEGNSAGTDGGAIYARNYLSVKNATFKNNTSGSDGGAIIAYSLRMFIENSLFEGNTSAAYGGALLVSGSNSNEDVLELNLTATTFKNNTSSSYGGAIYLKDARAKAVLTDFIGNKAKYTGAVYCTSANLEINGSTVENNTATSNAGAFGLYAQSTALLNNISADGNSGSNGGFAYVNASNLDIYNSTINNNTASGTHGGAIYYATDASGGVYATKFEGNHSANQGGAISVYTGGTSVLLHSCNFESNIAEGFGGAVFVSGKSILDMYNNVGTNNRGSHGGFMYETAASTVVKCIGLTVSGNSATTGGNIIWGNTLNAKLYINKAKYSDEDFSGSLNDAYWASAIANKLTVIEISDEVPKYLDYGNESYEHMKDAVDVSSAEELEKALALGTPHIRIVADFVIDRTFYISSNTTIFSTIERTLTRADDFAGDIFIVGETENGSILNEVGTIKFVLGNPLSIKEDLLTIDGNRDNMTVPVHGTVLFVSSGSKVDLYPNVTIINSLKTANEHILTDTHKISSAYKAGGAVSIIASGTLSIYGGKYKNNSSNVELGVTEEGKSDYTSTMGGAFYNYSNLTIYDGIFENNHSYSGGFLYNYCNLIIYGGNIIGNHSTKNGGAIYNANTSISHAFIGTDADSSSSNVLFENNTCDINGGAIYSPLLSVLNLYGNTTFRGNEIFSGHGGAIYLNGSFTARDTVFENNIAISRGGAIYNNKNHRTYDTRIVSITDCTFINNTAASGGAILLYASAADYPEGSIASITGCRFENNHATSSGGAIYSDRKSQLTITDTTFKGNHAEGQGGTLYAQGESVVKMSDSTINSSTAISHGGAIALHSAYLDLINTDIIGSMSSNNGGAIYISYSSSSEMNSKVNIDNCNIKDSISHSYGGAIYITRHSIDKEHRILTLKNSEISSNTAQYGGGAVYSASKVDAYYKNVDFIGNSTIGEGSDGGAIYAKGSYLTFDTVNFTENFAMQLGGAVYMDSGAVVVMNNIIASNNTADGSGGFLYTNGSELKVYDSTISENYSSVNGGAIAFYDDAVSKIYNTLFEKNYSAENGGAIVVYTGGTECMLHSCSFNGNTSENFGGAMYVSGSGLLNLYNITAEGNTALKGGMLYETTTGTSVTINGIAVKGNTATDSGNIIFGNSTGAVLNLNKSNYIDYDKGELDAEYWETLVANKLTVNYVTGSIPKAETYKGESETKPKDPVVKQPVLVDDVLSLGISSSDEDINSTYNALPRLDNSSNFMSKQTTKFPNINGETVTVDSLVYPAKSKADNPNFSQGLLIYQAILYKQAHPEEDVYIDAASYRFSVQAAVNINRNSRYFGYMRDLEDREYDKYGFVRISYLLITAAKMGINVTVIGHRDGYPVSAKALNLTDYFTTKLNDPCDPNYVENGVIGDYLDFHYIKWTLGQNKGGTDMMHTKLCAVSHYLDKDGNAHKNAVYTSSSNLDGIKNGVNGNWKLQTGSIISDHEGIYRASVNYLTLIAAYEEQGEIYEFQDIVNKRSTEQVDLILEGKENEIPRDEQIVYVGSETDNVFELYFTPLGGGRLAWEDKYNPYCKYIRKMYNSEDYIGFVWNAAEYNGKYTLGLQMERMITEAFHKNRNVKNSIYTIMESFDSTVFDDLKVGVDIGYKSFNKYDFGEIHNKDLLFSYVEGGERYFVSLLNSTNIHGGSMSYQSNFALVIKETDGCSENSVFYTMAENTASGSITEHYYGETKRHEPTETEDGYTYKECKSCGKQEKINVIHKESEWIIDRVPTASLRGIKHKECDVCGVTLESSELLYEEENSVDVSDINGKTFDETKESLINLDANEIPLTFEATVQLDSGVAERGGVIVGNYATEDGPQINFEIYSGGRPRLYYNDSEKGKVDCIFNTDIRSAKPKNIAITIDGNTVSLYVNGKLKETKTTDITIEKSSASGFKVGGDNRNGNASYFKGTIYYVNMFNEVRNESQIAKDQLLVIDNPSSLIYSSRFSGSRSNTYVATEYTVVGKTFNAAQSSTIDRNFGAAPRTIEAVVSLPEDLSGGTIVGNMGTDGTSTINLEVADGGKPQITLISDSGEKYTHSFNTTITSSTPTHIAVTLDGNIATLYVNGVNKDTATVSIQLPENATTGYLIGGDGREGNTNYFKGTIYSVNMFGDVRTSTEIKQDMSAVATTTESLLYSGYFVNEQSTIEGKAFTENVSFSVAENFEQTPKTIEATIQLPKSINVRAGVIIGNYTDMESTNVLNVEIMENGKPRLFFVNEKGEKVSCIFKEDIRSASKKHIAVTVDGTTATLYVDGVKSESVTLSATLPENATANYKIGGDNRLGNTQYFQGVVYSVNLFSDVRTPKEISEDADTLPQNADALMYSKAFAAGENISSVMGKTFDQTNINKIDSTLEKAPKTIEAYINVPKELNSRAGVIVGNYVCETSKNVINLEVAEHGKVRLFAIDADGKRSDHIFNVDVRSDSPVHIAITVNKKQAALYVNGVLAESAQLTAVLPNAIEDFCIGGDNRQDNIQYFKGTIYSVNLFGDVRTDAEILKDIEKVSVDEYELLYSNDFSVESRIITSTLGQTFKAEVKEKVENTLSATPKTIEAVIKLPKEVFARGGVIVGNYKETTGTNVLNLEVIENGKLRLFFVNEKGEKSSSSFKTDIRCENPTHIAVTINSTSATMYLNGKKLETVTFSYEPPINSTKNFRIGGDNRAGNTQYFKGTIYSVNMFSDERSADEIKKDVMFIPQGEDNLIFSRYYMKSAGITPVTKGVGKRFTDTVLNTVDSVFSTIPKTFEATISVPTSISDRAGVIIGNHSPTSTSQINLEVYTHGRVRLYYLVGAQKMTCLFNTDIRSNKPVHIAVTIEDNFATLYVNGKKAERSIQLTNELPSKALSGYCIGGDNRKGNTQYFKGTIYSVNLYSSVRTAAEILNSAINGTVESDTLLYSNVFDSLSCTKNTSGIDHEAGNWIIDYNATETEKGIKHLECTLCGKTLKVSEIGKLALGDNYYDISGGLVSTSVLNKTGTLSAAPKTFEMTVQLPPSFSDRAGVIIGNYTGGNENQINIEIYTNGQLRLYYKTGGTAYSYNFKTEIRSLDPVHIAITTSGTKASLYINGSYKEAIYMSRTLPSATENFCIGGDHRSGNVQYFKGVIHSVNIFSDVRTAEEIALDAKLVTSDTEGLVYSKYY